MATATDESVEMLRAYFAGPMNERDAERDVRALGRGRRRRVPDRYGRRQGGIA